jgi:ABC-type Fe3+/spermidine/putrescine transport system ATPase subunit
MRPVCRDCAHLVGGFALAAHPVSSLRVPSRGPVPAAPPPAAVLRRVRAPGLPVPLDLELAAGERLVLFGPTCAGKSAVLELLAGFTRPSSGEVLLEGRPAAGLQPHRRGLGLVLPGDGPLAHLTVAGTMDFARAGRGGDAAEVMQAFGLAGLGDRRAGDLSPEQRVRVALARALVGRTRLVLLDEPFAGLESPARESVLADLLPALAGTACVLATRDPAAALAFGGRVAVLEAGVVLQSAPAQQLYEAPATARVARLLGEANCLPGRVADVQDDIALVELAGGPRVEADATGAVAGAACFVVIRPERIAVAPGAPGEMGEGALAATVTALAWRGDHVRLTLSLGAATLLVTRPVGAPLGGLAPGRKAAVAWQPMHARLLQ